MLGYRIDFDHYLSETGLFSEIDFEETDNKECMLIVKCRLIKKESQPRLVACTIIDIWKRKLALSNQLYKGDLQAHSSVVQSEGLLLDTFTLTFASWHSIYLTGQIIVTR